MGTYFLSPNKEVTLSLFNGNFEESENIISRDRMLDASLVYNGNRYQIDESQWTDKDTTVTQFRFTPTDEGTYVTGVSTKARNIELAAEKFNDYLEHDGVLDMLEERKANDRLDQDAVESYQKHVKAIYQVGDKRSDDWKTTLGYPIEFVPFENPYDKHTGEFLDVQLLLDGKPLANQLVYADYIKVEHSHDHGGHAHSHEHAHDEHGHAHDEKEHAHDHRDKDHSHKKGDTHSHQHDHDGKSHSHERGTQLRTNDQGIVNVEFPEDGIYYLRTIHMVNVTDSDEFTHESKWATLSFEVTHKHSEDTHTHNDDHEHEGGIPTWLFIVGSLVVILVLFFVFRKKN